MMKRLQASERLCTAGAVFCFIVFLLMLGDLGKGYAAIILLSCMILLAVAASRIRKEINAIQLSIHQKLPVKKTDAQVIKRRVGHRYYSTGKTGVRSGPPMYYVTFATQDDARLELYVSRNVYFEALEGKTGILCYKGDEFISFN